jgi:thiamine-monophosphate kinase
MSMMNQISENRRIDLVARHFLNAPHRINNIHEADAEIVDLGESSEKYLAITTDALVEEISSGLYDDPALIGWMLATANFSDLAAVGADPLGLLVTMNYPPSQDEAYVTKLAEGISEACQKLGTFVLGGDTNQADSVFLSGCAVGLVPKKSVLTRVGAKPGDKIYLTRPAGLGSIYAFLRMTGQDGRLPKSYFRPLARIREGQLVREFASCCMDTSDGLLHTADTLMRLNRCQFVIQDRWARILHPLALEVCKAQNLPPWLVLAAVHGEFELCFTLRPAKERAFLEAASGAGWAPVAVGEVIEGEVVSIRTGENLVPLDTAMIRNIAEEAGSNPKAYIGRLLEIAREVRI